MADIDGQKAINDLEKAVMVLVQKDKENREAVNWDGIRNMHEIILEFEEKGHGEPSTGYRYAIGDYQEWAKRKFLGA